MAREFAKAFYDSAAWRRARAKAMETSNHLCAECLRKGLIRGADVVHHVIPITPENINDKYITLAQKNLRPLCTDCHAAAHQQKRRYEIRQDGSIAPLI